MFPKKQTQQPENHGKTGLHAEDEALFQALNRQKKVKKRRLLRMLVTSAVIAAIVLTVGVRALRRQIREQFAGSDEEILSQKVTRGTISTVVSGSGTLLNVDTEVVSVPEGVEITEILVSGGDAVSEGDVLAVADMATVRTALSALQEEIETLDRQITNARGDTVGSYLSAGVPGRVKILYGQVGDLVEDVMVDHGALAVISLDGFLAVEIETDQLAEGDGVTVLLSDGQTVAGTVDTVLDETATVLVTDNGPEYDETVTVQAADGTSLGSGKLYIHTPLKITGYAGTIKTVHASLNQQVYSANTLFTLTDTSTNANYDALLRRRSEKEETLLELLKIQRYNGLVAPISGSVFSVADLEAEETEPITEMVTLSPDVSVSVTISVDEGDILSLELGQEADVTVSSVSDETLTGLVTEINKTDTTGAYTAVVTLDKAEGMIAGMSAQVDVRIEGVEDAILIPADALQQNRSGYYVYTSYDEETETFGDQVEVIPGIRNSSYVEIKSGLSEGATVYYQEAQDFFSGRGFGNMPGGQMPNMGGSGYGGGQRPEGDRSGGMPGRQG